ncbi:MAG: 4Fe-4S ferredoxin [Saprospirales bacterium]|nr:4Fe-4S ferredoxin [Saprospirales bacterium]
MKYGFIIDNRKCIGCHACTTACKSEHDVPVGVYRTFVKQVEKGTFPNTRRVFTVMRCNHCTDAPCVEICPVEALYFRPDGIVDFDKNRCIGCKSCMQACPYDALYIDPDTHTAAKCNYCAQRIDIGLEPACVNVCPEHAIISGDMDNPNSEIAELLSRETVTVRKAAKGTHPNLFYIDGDEAALNPVATEKTPVTLWGAQARGVGHFAKDAEKLAYDGDDIVATAMKETTVDGNTVRPASSAHVMLGNQKRVYDAPDKGILWGWEVSAYVWTKAIAAGAFLVFAFASLFPEYSSLLDLEMLGMGTAAVLISLVFLGLTGILLIKDLDQPKRFLYVLLRPQWNSWLVKGAYAITLYGAMLTLWGLSVMFGWRLASQLAFWLAVVSGVITAVYTAFLFAQAKGRDFWQSPSLAVHMLVHSFMAGAAALAIATFFLGKFEITADYLGMVMLTGIGINLLTIIVELVMKHPTEDAELTVEMITKGRYSRLFWFGAIVMGNLLPFALLIYGGNELMLAASVLVLAGILITEKIWVEAPQRIPLN